METLTALELRGWRQTSEAPKAGRGRSERELPTHSSLRFDERLERLAFVSHDAKWVGTGLAARWP